MAPQRSLDANWSRWAAAVVLFLVPRLAVAQDPTAESLFRSGREAIQRGDMKSGCAQLAESDRIEPSPGAKLGLALCEKQLGHRVRAWTLFQEVVRLLPAEDERTTIAERHAAELATELALVTVLGVSGLPPSARVTSDIGELTLSQLGALLAFEAGPHYFEVQAPGRKRFRVEVWLQPGTTQRVELRLGSSIPPTASIPTLAVPTSDPQRSRATTTAPSAAPSSYRTLGFVLEGSAAALLLVGAASGALAISEKQTMNDACDARSGCSERGLRAAERGRTLATTSTVTFIGAVMSGAAGALLLILCDSSNAKRGSTALSRGIAVEF